MAFKCERKKKYLCKWMWFSNGCLCSFQWEFLSRIKNHCIIQLVYILYRQYNIAYTMKVNIKGIILVSVRSEQWKIVLGGNGHGHLYDDSSAPSLHAKNREIGAKEVKIKVSVPFINYFIYLHIINNFWFLLNHKLEN